MKYAAYDTTRKMGKGTISVSPSSSSDALQVAYPPKQGFCHGCHASVMAFGMQENEALQGIGPFCHFCHGIASLSTGWDR
jgi:hypothetical protein